jgi:hypothetical protein
MRTLLCLFQRRRQHPLLDQRQQRRKLNHSKPANASKAQVLVIFAFSVIALAAFMGLAIDAASIYLTHARLKRAVDAAAVSAANDIKQEQDLPALEDAAREVLMLHNVVMDDPDTPVELHVYDCEVPNLATLAPDFYNICPTTGYAKRKLIWVEATQASPLYFMQLIGFTQIPLTTSSISEAAPIDLMIVIDTSESMASETPGFNVGNYAPNDTGGCNLDDSCYPLQQAKDAAKALVDVLYPPYDRIGVVTYDVDADKQQMLNVDGDLVYLSDDFDEVNDALDAIKLHDDPPLTYLSTRAMFYRGFAPGYQGPIFNPIFPDDRDGDGLDKDNFGGLCDWNPNATECCGTNDSEWDLDLWHNNKNLTWGFGGYPCDDDDVLDVFDANLNGTVDTADIDWANAWIGSGNSFSINSTCAGCGIRESSNLLKLYGRQNAVWVIVFLSDGIANMTDTPATAGTDVVPAAFPNGFCMQQIDEYFTNNTAWLVPWCVDSDISDRVCIDTDASTCPPGSTHTVLARGDSEYTVYDWTRDMIDEAALTASNNTSEPRGNDIAIYSIALGDASQIVYGDAVGEELLRYMAAVGDDGDRTTDPCSGIATETNCGQYYYAPDGDGLKEVFEDIAGRIYTRITQ